MISTMLSDEFQICVTQGNFNNQIGLPLTLFRETKDHQIAVIEMGANAENEIDYLCDIARPQIGIITQIADAHLSGFGSIQGVAKAKCELFASLPKQGSAIVNLDSAELETLLEASKNCHQIKVSLQKQPDSNYWAEQIEALDNGWSFNFCSLEKSLKITLNLIGKHNIINALIALSAIDSLPMLSESVSQKLADKLSNLKAISGRLEVHSLPNKGTLFDDSYNANPTSVKAAIDMLSEQSGHKILVLGDMGELGPDEIELHQECGDYCRSKNIDELYCFGELSIHAAKAFGDGAKTFLDKTKLIENLIDNLSNNTKIVVKGSRAQKMEQIVTGIIQNLNMETPLKGNLLSKNSRHKNNKQEQI